MHSSGWPVHLFRQVRNHFRIPTALGEYYIALKFQLQLKARRHNDGNTWSPMEVRISTKHQSLDPPIKCEKWCFTMFYIFLRRNWLFFANVEAWKSIKLAFFMPPFCTVAPGFLFVAALCWAAAMFVGQVQEIEHHPDVPWALKSWNNCWMVKGNVVKTMSQTTHLGMVHIQPIYADLGDGLLLF